MQKSLFDLNEIQSDVVASVNIPKSKMLKNKEKIKTKVGKATQKVQEVIGEITMNETIPYVSMGEWSSHDLLFHILKQTGLANVYISTWSVSEDAVRQLIAKLKGSQIAKLFCVFDWRVKLRRPEAFELARFNIADIRLTTCHAKVTVIQNENWSIAIVGSANYTSNPRIEAGVISCDIHAANFHKKWILEELKNADPFETWKRKKKT